MKKILPHIALALVVALLMLMLVSWIWSAAVPDSGVRSMLSSEGIRWFLGHFADLLATPVLVWLLLAASAYGCARHSRLFNIQRSYRAGRARVITLLFVVVYVGIVLLLSIAPHAVLLSASGSLWPSPFSASLVPVLAFGFLSAAIIYGTVADTFQTLSDVYDALIDGLRQAAPYLLFYILVGQLYYVLLFVF